VHYHRSQPKKGAAVTELEPIRTKDLILHAAEREMLSQMSTAALQRPRVVNEIEAALEDSYGIETAGEVLLITMMPDDSQSMTIARKNVSVIEGHNDLLAAMRNSPIRDRILLQTRYLNKRVLNPFQPLALCENMSLANYACIHGTPLFQQTMVTLGTVIAKTEELVEQGAARVRTATLIMTDAEATDDTANELRAEVASVVADLRRIGDHIVAGMGFSAGDDTFFRKAFSEMGIEDRYIFAAQNRKEILDAFRTFGSRALALTAGEDTQRRVFEG
jgi:hypothetical protein